MHSRDRTIAGSMAGKKPGATSLPGNVKESRRRDQVDDSRTRRNLYGNDASTLDAGIYETPLGLCVYRAIAMLRRVLRVISSYKTARARTTGMRENKRGKRDLRKRHERVQRAWMQFADEICCSYVRDKRTTLAWWDNVKLNVRSSDVTMNMYPHRNLVIARVYLLHTHLPAITWQVISDLCLL